VEQHKIPYYKELDGIRGCAALLIFFFHFFHAYTPQSTAGAMALHFISFGPTMANLFFVLSGFLITQILLSSKGKENYFGRYYTRRVLRIFPAYYLLLIIYFFLMPVLRHRGVAPLSMQWYNWVYLQNLPLTFKWPHAGPKYLWSLAVEEHFYLVWPLLIYLMDKRKILIAGAAIFIIAFFCRIMLTAQHYPVFYFSFSTMDAFAAGSIAGVLQYHGHLAGHRNITRYILLITGLPAVVLWLLYFGERNHMAFIGLPVLFNIFYAALLSYIVTSTPQHKLKSVLSTRPMAFAGTISYGFFLFHPLCSSFAIRTLKPYGMATQLTVALLSSIAVASISYYCFERWFIRRKGKWG
jgi:peptidoglycan/LPS O-acetylase OafA/YrhL